MRHGFAGEYGIQGIAQIENCGGETLLTKIGHAIIDPAQIEQLAIGRENCHLRRDGSSGEADKLLLGSSSSG